ncbi:hypothetical protein OIO90_004109 [Microbotryomycetes sp. JL221]|nr:hypothetical protein OIO90_004109 [Microbotryomycetes sp. JL221]
MRHGWFLSALALSPIAVQAHSFNFDPSKSHGDSLHHHTHGHHGHSNHKFGASRDLLLRETRANDNKGDDLLTMQQSLELFEALLQQDVERVKQWHDDQQAQSTNSSSSSLLNEFEGHPDTQHDRDTLLKRALSSEFNYDKTKVRGVSLGGWLLLEPFITPGMFQEAHRQDKRVVDQYTLCKYTTSRKTLESRLLQHYKTFMTEQDLKDIKAAGLNHVRIPVPFWAINTFSEPYISSGVLYYLTWAVRWAGRQGIRVLIDLHGAPGAQNPWDNSGQQRQFGEKLQWTTSTNQARSKQVVQALVTKFTQAEYKNVVTAIQPVNEPYGEYSDVLSVIPTYYQDTYNIVRFPNGKSGAASNLMFSISDGFKGSGYWRNFMTDKQRVYTDQHIYSVFDNYLITLNTDQRAKYYCGFGDMMRQNGAGGHRPMIGEWTSATTDCSQKIPGVSYSANDGQKGIGWGSRYDGTYPGSYKIGTCSSKTGDSSKFTSGYKQILRRMFEVQTTVYEQGTGWIYWTWKTEARQSEDWSYQKGLQYGWIPRNPAEKRYGNQCA